MPFSKLSNELKLILLMTDDNNYSAQQLAEQLNITRRSLYNYFEFFRNNGFQVLRSGKHYRLNPDTVFFTKLRDNISFTRNEVSFLRSLLDKVKHEDLTAQSIKRKVERHYSTPFFTSSVGEKEFENNLDVIREAIRTKRVVMLNDYSSPHSGTVRNRMVEPFLLMNDGSDVRCFELKSRQCKTFKISRVKSVETLPVFWSHEDQHRRVFTDVFMFSGEEKKHVRLRLGQLSCSLLTEEFPHATPHLLLDSDRKHWILDVNVASYVGVGRFVLGLFDDVNILADDNFKEYIAGKIRKLVAKAHNIDLGNKK